MHGSGPVLFLLCLAPSLKTLQRPEGEPRKPRERFWFCSFLFCLTSSSFPSSFRPHKGPTVSHLYGAAVSCSCLSLSVLLTSQRQYNSWKVSHTSWLRRRFCPTFVFLFLDLIVHMVETHLDGSKVSHSQLFVFVFLLRSDF